jgi:diguanylate cyclase (GGDEF)-like protein
MSGYKGLVAAYVFSIAAAVALPAFALWNSHRDHVAAETVAQAERALATADRLRRTFDQIQGAGRAFVVTGRADERESAERHIQIAARQLDELGGVLSPGGRQADQLVTLRTVVAERIVFLRNVMDARENRGIEAALALARGGMERTAEVGRIVSSIGRFERAQLDDELTDKARMTATSTATLLFIVPLVIVVLTFFFRVAVREMSKRQRGEAAAREHARLDPLTGLPNRRALFERLSSALSAAGRHDQQFALLYLDLDGFKQVNDRLGHMAGDELLKLVGARISSQIRGEDLVARFGGDEFVIAPLFMREPNDANVVAAKLLRAVGQPYALGAGTATISVSIGVAVYPEHGTSAESLLSVADAALYRAKADGKSDFRVGDSGTMTSGVPVGASA